jgi:hypothetical protein
MAGLVLANLAAHFPERKPVAPISLTDDLNLAAYRAAAGRQLLKIRLEAVSGARDRIAQVGTVSRMNRVGSDSSWMLRTAAIRRAASTNGAP